MITKLRFSIDDFERMIDAGVFEGRTGKIELLEGELVTMRPASAAQSDLVAWLNRWSIYATDPKDFVVWVQSAIALPESGSVLEPDLVWLPASRRRGRPTGRDVALLIEVSLSSQAYDRGKKAELYARSGIADYWIVDGARRTLEVLQQPEGGEYRNHAVFTEGESAAPLCQPQFRLEVSELFASGDEPAP